VKETVERVERLARSPDSRAGDPLDLEVLSHDSLVSPIARSISVVVIAVEFDPSGDETVWRSRR